MRMTKFIHSVGGHSCLANHGDWSIIKSWAIKLLFSKYKLKYVLYIWNDASLQGVGSTWLTCPCDCFSYLFTGTASEAGPLGGHLPWSSGRKLAYRFILFECVYYNLFILGKKINWKCAVFPKHPSKFLISSLVPFSGCTCHSMWVLWTSVSSALGHIVAVISLLWIYRRIYRVCK